jgi:hypothetical protein
MVGKQNMPTEHWWNETDRTKPKYSEKNLSQCHLSTTNSIWPVLGSSLGPWGLNQPLNRVSNGTDTKRKMAYYYHHHHHYYYYCCCCCSFCLLHQGLGSSLFWFRSHLLRGLPECLSVPLGLILHSKEASAVPLFTCQICSAVIHFIEDSGLLGYYALSIGKFL